MLSDLHPTIHLCCFGRRGSHEAHCPMNLFQRLVCACCGGDFPQEWGAYWSRRGARCHACVIRGHQQACLEWEGKALEEAPPWS